MKAIDFTSALYLGFYHSKGSISPWRRFTTGVPSALNVAPAAKSVAKRLAKMQRGDKAVLLPSTLHLFWDLFDILARQRCLFYIDALAYPIARWGIERARLRGARVRFFEHHTPCMLSKLLERDARLNKRPVVVTDGFCPGCGRNAPLKAYRQLIRARNGILVLDDTQGLGILGQRKPGETPYGTGGGGSTVWQDVTGPDILVASSMAKAFGVPVAVLSGGKRLINTFERQSETRVHCSPPSNAVLHAAKMALVKNHEYGELLRMRLLQRVRFFQRCLAKIGVRPPDTLFPVQALQLPTDCNTMHVHSRLANNGIQTVLSGNRRGKSLRIVFILRADHGRDEIDVAIRCMANIIRDSYAKVSSQGEYGHV